MNNIYMLDIVVCHFNSFDFEKFLDFIKDKIECDCYVYDKTKDYYNEKYIVVPSENIGRESESYFSHIIQNYDNLNQYTLFIQDDTEHHIINHEMFLEECKDIINQNEKFKLFATSWRKGAEPIYREIIDGSNEVSCMFPSCDSIKKVCENNNIHLPQSYVTETCAFFICHKDIILSRPKDFYVRLNALLHENQNYGFVFEHMWKIIFA